MLRSAATTHYWSAAQVRADHWGYRSGEHDGFQKAVSYSPLPAPYQTLDTPVALCLQVRELIVLITFQRRVDAVVMLFRRTVDLDQFHA